MTISTKFKSKDRIQKQRACNQLLISGRVVLYLSGVKEADVGQELQVSGAFVIVLRACDSPMIAQYLPYASGTHNQLLGSRT